MIDKAIVGKGKYFAYAIYNDGNITKIPFKDEGCERPMKTYMDDGGLFVWIGKDKCYIKRLVARHFLGIVGGVVECVDGNENNCHIDNIGIAKRDNSGDNKYGTEVLIDGIAYHSISAAERELGVSHGYLTRYFKGLRSGKIFEGREVKLQKGE